MIQTARDLGMGLPRPRTEIHAAFKACRTCKLRGSQLCRIIKNEPVFGTHPPILRRFGRGERIFEQDQSSGFFGIVRRGYARRSVIKVSGKRILVGLAIPGDIVGGLLSQEHGYDFDAATDIEICSYDSATIKRQLEINQPFRKSLLQEMNHQHHRLLDALWHNGSLTSRERIIGFLISAVEFMPTEPLPDGSLILSMELDRGDWGDLTNTVVETISRTLRYLEGKKLITCLTPYRFRIHDLDSLATIAGVELPARRVAEGDHSKRMETCFRSLKSGHRMTAVNALGHGANRLNAVMKPVSVQKRGLARRRPEDVQEKVRD
ncbi:Crp/Fnr family transcriptional regulator [Pseudophaeobacter profundi]|uniref:Crp/Fnr family transcriptional regulator n=1 Tax=Pseudophaeobacter profundi TaxID=3034152 RepID=UPI0024324872|nr:Crp/Fnr family transcriptional regulator [Pseudophaeobacter profundi]